ncbi:MAG: hypothetical protein MJZ59_00770 [Paludibacteraceae bacterium]|nr:hypothetical protein [Paludibacteraceae bacterium]
MNKTWLILMLLPTMASAQGFWMRYAKNPPAAFVDSAYEQKEAEREAKKVRFIYDVDFDSYFDNREYYEIGDHYQIPQTLFAFRLSPTVGVQIKDRIGGSHRLIAGVRYTQPLGGNWKDANVVPTAYYHFSHYGVNLQLGAIPYENRILSMPDWLQYDSIAYARPNIQGALISYQDKRGYAEFMCDWRGALAQDRREMFRILFNGQYQHKWFFTGGLVHMNHTACSGDPEKHAAESLYDDVNVSAHIGLDFTQMTPLDSLAIKVSYIYGYARDRKNEQSFNMHGMLAEVYLNWWFLGVKNTTYVGNNLQPLRNADNLGTPIGSLMCQGDPFYQATFYNRTDFFVYLYRSSFVNCYMSWNMHYDNCTKRLQHQQQLIVRFDLNGVLHDKQGALLRGLFEK